MGKDTHKLAKNMKLVSVFFAASESILEIHLKDTSFNLNGERLTLKRSSLAVREKQF